MSAASKMAALAQYEAQGAAAAREGKTRKDCPYIQGGIPAQDEAWNFWVYGNENEQAEMVKQYQKEKGTYSSFWMTTGEQDEATMKLLEDWGEQFRKDATEMRAKKGWGG